VLVVPAKKFKKAETLLDRAEKVLQRGRIVKANAK